MARILEDEFALHNSNNNTLGDRQLCVQYRFVNNYRVNYIFNPICA